MATYLDDPKLAVSPGLQAAPPKTPTAPKPGPDWVAVGDGWVPPDHPLAKTAAPAPTGPAAPAAPAAPSGPPTTQSGVLNTPVTAGGQTAQGAPTTIAGAFQQALVNRLAPQDISANNPAIKGSIAANRNAEQRGLSRTQEALAERAAATGQTGAFETGLRQALGESAGRQGAYEGNALFGLHQQQANDLSQALGLGGSMLSDQQRQELQRYGVDLDAALRREGLSQQGQLGNRELDIRNTLGLGNLGLGYAGLKQSGEQFKQGLGANLGIEQARLNQQALLQLLGGF